jgi:hypothetical protein
MYSELFPVLALATLVVAAYALWRARRGGLGRLASFAGVALLAVAVSGNYEYIRAARGILFAVGHNGVGGHVPWHFGQYARFALGFYTKSALMDPGGQTWLAGAPAAVVGLLGLARALRHRRALPLTVAGLTLAGLAVYFRFRAHDPWTGEVGHTWNLFKLSKWSFPLVAALEAAGVALVLRRMPRRPAVLLCAALTIYAVVVQVRSGRSTVDMVHAGSGRQTRPPDLRRLCRLIDARAPRRLYVVNEPTDGWDRWFPAYLLYPRPFVNSWKGSGLFETADTMRDRPDAFEPGTLFLQHGVPPFSEPVEQLPFDYAVIDGTRPLIFRVQAPARVEGSPGTSAAWTWVGTEPVGLFVFSPRPCHALLSFDATAGPGLPETARRRLRLTEATGASHEETVEAVDGSAVTFPVVLAAGVSRLELRCLDRPTASDPDDPRVKLVKAGGMRLVAAEAPQESPPTAPGAE